MNRILGQVLPKDSVQFFLSKKTFKHELGPWMRAGGSGGEIMVSSFFHHGDGAPQWRAWGPPTGPIPVPVRPYSGIRCFMMYIKAEQRAKSIGGFIGDEIMIAVGDVSWLYKKVYLVPGTTLKN